ncbi:beta-phosphoglucomutase family hydrolase [Methylocaldum sp.]|uniref:HAD family hydrolase n=1 Tax=Methylocaldum sp. TaxID=1969727 RepID=UPI002D4363E1|nr:beta-phosphoglucomutase family hydrolase [Methylocaldum sp.]HYE37098.1 beta-phosphoglucomutase family hydrolase [Methylocaldum sp.]
MSIHSSSHVISRRDYDAVIFDLDGVITQTATLHKAAWKTLFDDFLERHAARLGGAHRAFDADSDYRLYIDGKARYEGVASFLASRGIALPYGDPGDGPDEETVCGLGNKKNAIYRELLEKNGVEVYPSTIDLIHKLRSKKFATAVVSASRNCAEVLEAAHLSDLFDTRVDGIDLERMHLPGKPAPDSFLEAARRIGVEPTRAVVVEDAIAGVEAGRNGGFGCVIGVDRTGHADALKTAGANIVVADLAELDAG